MQHNSLILVLNAGSSSLKFAVFRVPDKPTVMKRVYHGEFRDLDNHAHLSLFDGEGKLLVDEPGATVNHKQAVNRLIDWLKEKIGEHCLYASGHRVVPGGAEFTQPVKIDQQVLDSLKRLTSLAPLHMPHNLAAIDAVQQSQPNLPQVACFDTSFHHDMAWPEQVYALPSHWVEAGVRRYGFHGLSYEYIAHILPQFLGEAASGRIIVAHLGHGASLCAMREGRSIATTMGFTPLDGLPMATRPGQIDPGVITWLIREAGLSVTEVDAMLSHQSGLLGLPGSHPAGAGCSGVYSRHRPELLSYPAAYLRPGMLVRYEAEPRG